MMQTIRVSLLASLISNYLLFSVNAQDELNAFDSNINSCLFDGWRRGPNPVITAKMECSGHTRAGLCYGIDNGDMNRRTASFAVCYNQETLIPEFTGHVVVPLCGRDEAAGRDVWRNEGGRYAPNTQSDEHVDYEKYSQRPIVPNFDDNTRFYGRGHLTPNIAFGDDDERQLTMVNTNIAPQWQLFNAQNWATLERAVQRYSVQRGRRVYVVTGTGGEILRDINGAQVPLKLNNKVLVPKYYWKAVCDPEARKSVVFVAPNPTGAEGDQTQGGCVLNIGRDQVRVQMTPGRGIIHCYSLNGLRRRGEAQYFKLPPFGDVCTPSERGEFLDQYLQRLN